MANFLREELQQKKYRDYNTDFDTLVGTGLSGALVVPTLARNMGKSWAIVRKRNDGSHAQDAGRFDRRPLIEGRIGRRWLFVDDQIDSGITLKRVGEAVASFVKWYNSQESNWNVNYEPFSTQYVGYYLYLWNTLEIES